MPLDPATLDSDTPRTLDGREYPGHLRVYEELDAELLPIASRLGEFTYDDLLLRITDPKIGSVLPRWLASAEWRGLIERRDHDMASQRTNVITSRGRMAARHN